MLAALYGLGLTGILVGGADLPTGVIVLTVPSFCGLIAASLHEPGDAALGLILLWGSVIVQAGMSVVAVFSVGLYVVPAALLLLVAAISGTVAEFESAGARGRRR